MRISRVIIENWRSVKYIDFEPSDMTVLVGANNAGKTNILSAINLLLGDRWPMPGNLLDSDFYLSDRSREIFIQLDFDDAPYTRIDFNTERSSYTLQAYDLSGRPARYFNNEERSRLTFAYVDAARSFDKQFGSSRYSLFGQAIRLLHDNLRKEDERLPKLRESLDQAHELLKTDLYQKFESCLREAFSSQLKTSRYDVQFEFRTLDETNLYRSLYPTLIERGLPKSPTEVGSGVRNLLVLALFHAVARSFKGGAILGIEEPELFLHPHAQRSLMNQFEELVSAGSQLFISSHSSTFLDITRPERVVVVECGKDDDDEISTSVRTTTAEKLLKIRKELHPEKEMTIPSMRAFLRNTRTLEMTEPYFSKLVIVAEGPSEREALPIFSSYLGVNFDEYGISIVAAGGKTVIDTLVQVYQAHNIPTFVIFDNDNGLKVSDREYNKVMCRLLEIDETASPNAAVTSSYAILEGNWEESIKADIDVDHPGRYDDLVNQAREMFSIKADKNKPLVARYVAEQLVKQNLCPSFIRSIAEKIKVTLGLPVEEPLTTDDEDDIPF